MCVIETKDVSPHSFTISYSPQVVRNGFVVAEVRFLYPISGCFNVFLSWGFDKVYARWVGRGEGGMCGTEDCL